jgi:hydroxymethylpyrimidine/phosphomethylpyrimidine kinase
MKSMTRRKKPQSQTKSQTRSITLARQATALTIAGSDPSGGAGLQADLKAFQQNGVYGMSVVTLLTVQNTFGVQRIEVMPVDLVVQQLDAVLSDIPPRAIKTGALGNPAVLRAVAERLSSAKQDNSFQGELIVDPVLISKHGDRLAADSMIAAYREHLLPLATLITPNRFEAEALLGQKLSTTESFCRAAVELLEFGPECVLIKAGVVDGLRQHFLADKREVLSMGTEDRPGNHGHGAGCSLSATIAARLALSDQAIAVIRQREARIGHGLLFHERGCRYLTLAQASLHLVQPTRHPFPGSRQGSA